MFNNASNGGYSLADVAAVTGNSNGGWGGFGDGNGWWIILLFIVFFGGWGGYGNGWGGNNGSGSGTPQAVSAMNTDYISTGIRDLTGSVANDFYTLNTGLLNGFCDVQGAIANSTASITGAVNNGFNTQNLANLQNTNTIQSTLAAMASNDRADTATLNYNLATQMCATNTNNSNNTRDIIEAINSSNRSILEAMSQNKVEAMQDKINDLQSQLQTANFLASQAAQNAYLVDQLNPAPIPAYVVQRPGCNAYNMMTTV